MGLYRIVYVTSGPTPQVASSEHEATGLTAHIHTCTFLWRAKKDGGDSNGFVLLWEKTGESSDSCLIQALV